MAHAPLKPLTLLQAKEQLRAAGQRLSLAGWLQHRPWQVLFVALSCGFLAGNRHQSGVAVASVLQQFAPVVVSALLGGKKTT
ncbi:MAG: hypothetical protein COX17_03570 [Deltaproteobacteria bacterium CG23_combo_of_CG06-09_8_20_14_all_60_8]|nr:MAG: hypothetical protein AUK28_05875 [Desulfobacterales bacterium CG2_30_60_27]PIP44059.1 MAG: hypothetical protein COX17_03570 [Deltaproteobacteria bacterium CG23_combo_of_CG06-09_8_20_14_all_60_8]